jgi:hypothetical protein
MALRSIFGWAILFCFLLIFTFSVYRKYELKRHYHIAQATILQAGIRMQKNGSWLIIYSFVDIKGDTIRSKTDFFLRISLKDSLIGRTVPCAYYKNNSKISELLIYEHTWKQYGLVYPDSMKWTKRFFKDIIYSY